MGRKEVRKEWAKLLVKENIRHEKFYVYVLRNCPVFGQLRNVLKKDEVIFKEAINCHGYA